MNDHVTKPIDPDALFAVLARWTKPDKARAEAPKTPAQAPAANPEIALPEIAGVDTVGALKRVAGNRRLYRSLLEQFAAKHAGSVEQIENDLRSNARESAERMAHTLKGIAGNIGITRVHEVAAKVEAAIRKGDESVYVLLPELSSVLAPQIAAIRSALGDGGEPSLPAGEFNLEAAVAAVTRLRSLIESNDGDAADVVDQVAGALGGKADKAKIDGLRDALTEFDFDAALARLDEIARDCGVMLETRNG
jgi:HPt (histidine-containing phosphotransfer) domain-containing protein